jgi:formate C-acetyltransferase
VLNRDELLAAQREPEKHSDLIVRIGGYSEYFVRLDRKLQDSVIARTEHGGTA